MNKFFSGFLGAILLSSSVLGADTGVAHATEDVTVDEVFENTVIIGKEELNQYAEDTSTEVKHNKFTTMSGISSLDFQDSIEVDLATPDEVLAAKELAESKGNEFELSSIAVSTQYFDSNGKLLTKKDVEEILKEHKKVTFLDSTKLGIGNDPSLKEIQKWEEKQDRKLEQELEKEQVGAADFQTAALTYRTSGYRAYTYVQAYVYIWEEKSGTSKRNYLQGKFSWPNKTYAGDVTSSASDFIANETMVLAWNRGPTGTTGTRSARLEYEDLYNTNKKTITNPSRHTDEGSYSAAYKFNALPYLDGRRFVIRNANIFAYTGWWTPSSYGDDGSVTAQYAHGTNSTSITGFSVSTGLAASISWSKTTNYTFAKVWGILPRN